jgi:NADH:ubiquinone oxidoreductase subunit F (NADH-binding)
MRSTRVARWPETLPVASIGPEGRLVVAPCDVPETCREYEARGGYGSTTTGADLIAAVERSGLVGRGGAAFPAATKLRAVRAGAAPRCVVANGEEGEPLSVKDRWLLRIRPHLVLDGLLLAASAVGAAKAFVYVSDPMCATSVEEAVEELGDTPVPIDVVRVPRSYVAGEETAVVRAIDGGPALPTDKPPRPFESGVGQRPTLVSNVETLANLPFIAAGRDTGQTILVTLSGAVARPGLYEVPLGTMLTEVIEEAGGLTGTPTGALMGGYFAGLIGPRVLDLLLSHSALRAAGTGLGCGAIHILGDDDCPVWISAEVMAYFERHTARQCGPCIRGTSAMSAVLRRLATGTTTESDLDRLAGWSRSLKGRGGCAHLDGATNTAATVLSEFAAEVDKHRNGTCSGYSAHGIERLAVSIDG